jgi:hypothetical protein
MRFGPGHISIAPAICSKLHQRFTANRTWNHTRNRLCYRTLRGRLHEQFQVRFNVRFYGGCKTLSDTESWGLTHTYRAIWCAILSAISCAIWCLLCGSYSKHKIVLEITSANSWKKTRNWFLSDTKSHLRFACKSLMISLTTYLTCKAM